MWRYDEWVRKASQFFEAPKSLHGEFDCRFSALPSLDEEAVSSLDRQLRIKMPSGIREFLLVGAGGLSYSMHFHPNDEGLKIMEELFWHERALVSSLELCVASEFADYQVCCIEWTSTWPESQSKLFWHELFPFAYISTGDSIGMEPPQTGGSSIYYMNHDGEENMPKIADSFEEYLELMQELCFLNFYQWHNFMDPKTNKIRRDEKLRKLHQLFGVT